MSKTLHRFFAAALAILNAMAPLGGMTVQAQPAVRASTPAPSVISLVPGTVDVEPAVADMLLAILASAGAALPRLPYYSVSDVRAAGDWWFISLVGLSRYDIAAGWRLEESAWIGVVVARRDATGHWSGVVEGTPGFAQLLDQAPDSVIAPSAKASLNPARRGLQPAETYILPWQAGTSMYYGVLGVHNGDYVSVVGDYKGVDLLSDGDTALGHAPNRLLAAASGAISYVCRDSVNLAIRIGNMMYVHLVDNPNLVVGHAFNQGDELGQLKPGSFSANCGHASQGDNWFHVHWTFPNTGAFQAGGWTLNWANATDLSMVPWTRGAETRPPQTWLLADNVASDNWHVEYFADTALGNRCFDGYDSALYIFKNWDQAAPATNCPTDSFSARFTRAVNLPCGHFHFAVHADDGVRLWAGSQNLLDQWPGQVADFVAEADLPGGDVTLRVEYYDATGDAALSVGWEFISSVACAEAKPDLYPYTPVGYAAPVLASGIYTPGAAAQVTNTLYAGRPAFFDWYFTNGGYASTSSEFQVELWIDDALVRRSSYSSFEAGWVGGEQDWETTVVTPGLHLVRLAVDPANSVAEADETNNTWEGWLNWQVAPGTQLSVETRYRMFLPVMLTSH
jgi:hypothetical protein